MSTEENPLKIIIDQASCESTRIIYLLIKATETSNKNECLLPIGEILTSFNYNDESESLWEEMLEAFEWLCKKRIISKYKKIKKCDEGVFCSFSIEKIKKIRPYFFKNKNDAYQELLDSYAALIKFSEEVLFFQKSRSLAASSVGLRNQLKKVGNIIRNDLCCIKFTKLDLFDFYHRTNFQECIELYPFHIFIPDNSSASEPTVIEAMVLNLMNLTTSNPFLDDAKKQGLFISEKKFSFDSNITNLSVGEKVSLEGKVISLDDNKAIILADEKRCSLPPYRNEHFFCRVAFEYPSREPVDWSIIYQKMTHKEPEETEQNLRTVRDTMYRVNKRIKEVINTEDELFKWRNKSITRQY